MFSDSTKDQFPYSANILFSKIQISLSFSNIIGFIRTRLYTQAYSVSWRPESSNAKKDEKAESSNAKNEEKAESSNSKNEEKAESSNAKKEEETEFSNVKYEEEYITNSKGIKLFTCRWFPTDCEPKALVFLNHGYAMEISVSMKGAAMRLVKAGFGVYGIDNQGHGKSEGIQGLIPRFDDLVDDSSKFFTSVCEKEENKNKLRILLGESMGGAMVLRLHRKEPEFWDGGVLVAPMCKIADDMKPPKVVVNVLLQLKRLIPTWKIVPGQDVVELAFRDPKIRQEIRDNPLCYKGRVRLQTATELFKVTVDLEKRLKEVKMPFLIVHGEDDKVTDPSTSKLLYETASSTDKTIKLYPGMWHALTYGEFTENIDIVFADIISWINERIERGNSRLEREKKNTNDELQPTSEKNE